MMDAARRALKRKAEGFWVEETKTITEEDEKGNRKVKTERTRKRVPPDLSAIQFWMQLTDGETQSAGIQVISLAPRPEKEMDV